MCLPQVIKSFQNYRGVATTFYPTLVIIILVLQGRTAQLEKNAMCGRLVCDVKISAKELIRSRSYDLGTLCQNVRIKVLQVRWREAFVLGASGNRKHGKQSCLS